MITLGPNQSVGEIVRQQPMRSRVFEALKIDYCCGGKVSLARACEKHGIRVAEVLQKIEQSDAQSDLGESSDPDAMSLGELADHIEATHHAYLREELPRLDWMTEKVARVHGETEPRLQQVREAFVALRAELEPHMMKEEQVLFPIVRRLESSGTATDHPCGSVANPIRQMEHEHDRAGDALAILRAATDDYAPPEWACNTYRAMLASLEELEADMHQHIHKENNVLFPKAIKFEASS